MSKEVRRSLRRSMGIAAVALATSTLAVLSSPTGCGIDNAVVGGSCEMGFTQCGELCVNTTDDPKNCGSCGHVCPSGDVCRDSQCVGESDASHHDASGDAKTRTDGPKTDGNPDGTFVDGTSRDVSSHDGSPSDGSTLDGHPTDGTSTDVVEETCTPPLVACEGMCVDETSDPDNCGACGKVCPSGICYMSNCEGSTEGDIVVIGHDYHSSTTGSAGKLITNAVFLPSTATIRILSFEEYSDPTSVSNVKSILGAAATMFGRTLDYTVTSSEPYIPAHLMTSSFDILIVYDQEAAPSGDLGPLGTSWASTLASFTIGGGVVIALDGAAGTTREMPLFITNAGLLAVSAHTVISKGTALDVVAPGDVIGHGVVSPYAAEPDSVFFTTSTMNGGEVTYVVEDPFDAGGMPVVVHIDVP
jgi:stigma-specific protein Stig1